MTDSPTKLDITRYIGEALNAGMEMEEIAEAIFETFRITGVNLAEAERLADRIQDAADHEYKVKLNNERTL